jgi:hypothetical protein
MTVEDLILANEWPYETLSQSEIIAEVTGHWCDYRMHFAWHEEVSVLQFYILLDMFAPPERQNEVYKLLSIVNEQLLLGNFEVFSEESIPAFRHGLLLQGTGALSAQLLEELIDIAIDACEKFYPAFQFVIWGRKSAEEASSVALIETVGEA